MSNRIPIFDQSGNPLGTLDTNSVGPGLESLATGAVLGAVVLGISTIVKIMKGLVEITADTIDASRRKDSKTVSYNLIAMSAVLFVLISPCLLVILIIFLNKLTGQ